MYAKGDRNEKPICFIIDDTSENGSKLSGGQKQKLALARLFLISNKTLLLDEAFSAIDVKNKVEILDKLFAHYREDTVICVSHDAAITGKFISKIIV